ncbi:MAG TPA: ATP-binding protein [Nitrosopumilaceae archaeon]|nr:ATP-binding protein [Nitrosopumilaceae archaeon]
MIVGKPPKDVVDRKEEVGKIVNTMLDTKANVNYALIGHRRIGKSTILGEVRRQIGKKLITVYVDFGEFRYSPVDLAEKLTEELTHAYYNTLPTTSKIASKVKSALTQLSEIKRVRARFIAGIDEQGSPIIAIDPYVKDRDENYRKALTDVFEYANKISEASGRRVVIIIDEFQHIIEYKKFSDLKNILDVIRAILERRKNVSFIVSGSRIHYLRNILAEGGSPLFGHFIILEIKELAKIYAVELFLKSQPAASKQDAERAFDLVGGHPFYLVMLGHAYKKTESLTDTYQELLTSTTGALYIYVNYIVTEDLGSDYKSTAYWKILVSLSTGEKTVSDIAKDASLKMTGLPKFLTKLIEYDLVQKTEGKYSITDKIIRDFFNSYWV